MAKEMTEYGIEVLEMSKARWKGMGSVILLIHETVLYAQNHYLFR